MKSDIRIGDKVTFDLNRIEAFTLETNSDNLDLIKYQKIILAGANLIGIAKNFNENMVVVSYQDGWEIPIPLKYLVSLSEM